jgi:DNA-binding transcriptional regulator YhcF (GntR family)
MSGLRFGREARGCTGEAIRVAARLGHDHVGVAHLLVAVARTAPGLVPGMGTGEELERRLASFLESSAEEPGLARPYTKAALRALAAAQVAAREKGRSTVGVEDLLRAVRSSDDDVAAALMEEVGIRRVGPSDTPGSLYGAGAGSSPGPEGTSGAASTPERRPPDPREFVHLSDQGDRPYYDQIADSIREAVASGRLIPGDRLPAIRRVADALDLAPGTVARAWGVLEEEGVVVTAGARGTRVAPPVPGSTAGGEARVQELAGLLRPVVVTAFHLGADADEVFEALRIAVRGVLVE